MNPHIEAFVNNAEMFEAVKAELLSSFSFDVQTDISNDRLGEIVRARVDGSNLVKAKFRELEKYRTPPREPESFNPAR